MLNNNVARPLAAHFELSANISTENIIQIIEEAGANMLLLDRQFKVLKINKHFFQLLSENYNIYLNPGTDLINELRGVNHSLALEWKTSLEIALSGNKFSIEKALEKTGRKYYWELQYIPYPLLPNLHGVAVIAKDITDRKNYERQIAENEANLRSIFNAVPDSIWLIDPEFRLIDFNDSFALLYKAFFGIDLVKGSHIFNFDELPDELNELKERWAAIYLNGLSGKQEVFEQTYSLGEKKMTFEIVSYPIYECDKVVGLTLCARDISINKIAEQRLKVQNEELIKINEELDRFVYSASHDLRAPLMSIKGLLHIAKIEQSYDKVEEYLGLIEKSVNRLDSFISDIINYSKNSRLHLEVSKIDFSKLIDDSISSLKFIEGADDVRSILKLNTENDFYSDYRRILVVFNNIISNAVRYRDTNKDSFIEISVNSFEEHTRIKFTDNGIGIAESLQDKIFDMFYRASQQSKGSGLGLYIVKESIEKLKGTIRVKSKYAEGTTFEIYLPNLKSLSPEE